MSNPIKETPILYGDDAKRFVERFNDPNKKNSISDEERQRMKESFDRINAMILEPINK
jgi:hypothetical protein